MKALTALALTMALGAVLGPAVPPTGPADDDAPPDPRHCEPA